MMNRRNVLKYGLGAISLGTSGFSFSNTTNNIEPVFEKIYTEIKLKKGQSPEFLLDFLCPGTKREYAFFCSYKESAEKFVDRDYIIISTPFDSKKPASDYDYGAVTLASALDRNVIVYDEKAKTGWITERQIQLMKRCMSDLARSNRIKLTDIFYQPDYNFPPVVNIDGVKFHSVHPKIWKRLIDEYKNIISFPENKKYILIGVCANVDYLIKPIRHTGEYGIANIDSRSVILGAY